jgi:hypothetical protein
VLGEFGRESRCAAIGRETRGVVERGGDVRARRLRRQRKVTGTEERVVDDAGNTLVNAATLLSQVLVKDRGQQRVREANGPVFAFDHICSERRAERVCRNARPLEERLRRSSHRGGERERLTGGGGELVDPRAHELFERLGNRKRLKRVDVRVENAGQLEREERVTARPLVDAEQRLPRESPVQPVAQEPMERAHAERPHDELPDALCTQGSFESRLLLRALAQPPCK